MCERDSAPRDKLRLIRHEHGVFEPRFFERSPLFWPIERAARVFVEERDWPSPPDYGRAFLVNPPPVRFELQPLQRKRPKGFVDRDALYDAKITKARVVPTRARMWHDYLNALVWTTFPQAKLALHRRQHLAIEAWVPEGATQLPNARTRELDALALLDEGGVLLVKDERAGEPRRIVFGHALYEGLVLSQPAMVARALSISSPVQGAFGGGLTIRVDGEAEQDLLLRVDEALAALLRDPGTLARPDELTRVPLVEANKT